MDKTEVKRVLVPYCPPLGTYQLEQIASELAEISQREIEAAKAEAAKASTDKKAPKKKSRSPKKKRKRVKEE